MSTSPGYERLHRRVQRWVWSQGWHGLRDVQERAVAPILAGDHDVILAAATAAGKTEAAFLPIASRLLDDPAPSVRALYVSPLKALINDQHRRLEEMCRALDIEVHRWHGDVAASAKNEVLEDPSGVLLITPESLEAMFVLRGTRLKSIFEHLVYVVIDELHSFLGTERGRQLQSQLHRLELCLRRRIPRVGLSATLGDLAQAGEFLRPRAGTEATVVEASGDGRGVRLQLRAYEEPREVWEESVGGEPGAEEAIAEHLFATLRGSSHLVFANGRSTVEAYAARLRELCEDRRLPNEFFPHHGSLSKSLREDVERALRDSESPRTVVCTSTLEMGIDVGEVSSVAQIGAPPSVAALRQRLGRSGRRGEPSILRAYVRERRVGSSAAIQDRLREELVQAVAMVELLLEGWCEPAAEEELHLSTLVQQVLSTIAQHSGARAEQMHEALCASGPFRSVDAGIFAALLRAMGAADLVTQNAEALILAGLAGEREIADYHFFAAFETDEEFRVLHEGRELGAVPVHTAVVVDSGLVVGGRRWRVREVDEGRKEIHVVPGGMGDPPLFHGSRGEVHDVVRERMRRVLGGEGEVQWVNSTGNRMLEEARATYAELELDRRRVLQDGENALLFPWAGDRVGNTLVVALSTHGVEVSQDGLVVRAEGVDEHALWRHLGDLEAEGVGDPAHLAAHVANKLGGKYDAILSEDLLCVDYASRALDIDGTLRVLRATLAGEP